MESMVGSEYIYLLAGQYSNSFAVCTPTSCWRVRPLVLLQMPPLLPNAPSFESSHSLLFAEKQPNRSNSSSPATTGVQVARLPSLQLRSDGEAFRTPFSAERGGNTIEYKETDSEAPRTWQLDSTGASRHHCTSRCQAGRNRDRLTDLLGRSSVCALSCDNV